MCYSTLTIHFLKNIYLVVNIFKFASVVLMKNTTVYSTGVPTLDALIEQVHPGDNFVFNCSSLRWFRPLARALAQFCIKSKQPLVLLSLDGSLDDILLDGTGIIKIKEGISAESLQSSLRNKMRSFGKETFYIFDNADQLIRILGGEQETVDFFKAVYSLMRKNGSLAYWPFSAKKHSRGMMASLNDLAPVFIDLKQRGGLTLRIVKAAGRYSNRIYIPHQITGEGENLRLLPMRSMPRSLREYAHKLERKNRELLKIKKNLEHAREELIKRTKELKSITKVALSINRFMERDRILRSALRTTLDAVDIEGGAIFLNDRRTERFEAVACDGISRKSCESLAEKKLWEQMLGKLPRFTKPVLLFETDKNNCSQWLNSGKSDPWKTLFITPLRAQNRLVGIMILAGKMIRELTAGDIAMLKSIGNQVAMSIVHADLYRRIKNSETRYRNLFESAQDGIFILDAETGRIQEANAQATALTGYSERQLRSIPFWDLTVAENRPKIRAHFRNGNLDIKIMGEMPLLRKGGSVLMTEVYSNLVQIEGKRLLQCLIRNITSRVKAERMIREAVERAEAYNAELATKNRELEEVSRSKTEFLNFVSHELRTPLMTLQWGARSLQRVLRDVDIEDSQRLLHIVQEDSKKLSLMVNQLLEFSRIEANMLRLNKRAGSILPLLNSIIEGKKDRIQEKKIKFSVHAPKNLAKVLFDPQQIEIVLNNIIDNSLKYSLTEAEISIVLKQKMAPEPMLEIRIQDNGAGIPESDLERVFEKYYRGSQKEILQTAGTGLGLPISRAIIEAHSGRIWAEKPGPKGCVVAFTLPMVEE